MSPIIAAVCVVVVVVSVYTCVLSFSPHSQKYKNVHSVCTVICCLLFLRFAHGGIFFLDFFLHFFLVLIFHSAESEILLEIHLFRRHRHSERFV